MTILVTGGAGFIGSNFILDWFKEQSESIVNVDKLTYAANPCNLSSLKSSNNYTFVHADICDNNLITHVFEKYKPRAVINFAADSHVDRSISEPESFIKTNIFGAFNLLEVSRFYWNVLPETEKSKFRFFHVSTDEVYGSLDKNEPAFTETNRYKPNSPYSASKASSDHLVRAYNKTYGLPTLITNCSNNYGPYQFPEKLIPLIIHNAVNNKPLPIYGDGQQIRDWLYVGDHCSAIRKVLKSGKPGEIYNIGGLNEKANIEVVEIICAILDEIVPRSDGKLYKEQIAFVKDRPGHDKRYAIDASKIEKELNWKPSETFENGLYRTVKWYMLNQKWVQNVTSGKYLNWIKSQYQQTLEPAEEVKK